MNISKDPTRWKRATTDRELRKLKRRDLLQLLLESEKENRRLTSELIGLRSTLEKQDLVLEEVGSIAEASLQLSNVFDEAQKAADNYLENVRRVCDERDRKSRELAATRIERSRRILEETERRCRSMEQEARAHAKRLLNDAAGAGRGDTE